ncbi:CopG family transcriptional regulator [Paenibacillus sp. 7124]|uniref:CopG family transcriptional regulator n=1 Tax=Paenibacillus apii TaxID=1850370 RepID=A0A6M1PHZ1_9BACL|nr:CopG family transcriptional regulator [Paenibacillus apii]NGM83177.1 CopG family transcriptional regulator [Paenibacillus apii]NJJ38825.1 CopG family transcriptional regulator [Paenibacillus apii]
MADQEKITINLGPVDLGQVDLLVDQGFYSNRTDFIRIAIRNQLQNHTNEVQRYTTEKFFVMGVLEFNRERLEEVKRSGKTLDIKLIGALIVSNDVTPSLAKDTFGKLKLYGILRAPNEVKQILQDLSRSR